MQQASRNDPVLSKAFHYTKNGWPNQVEDIFKPYWNHHNELCIEGGCLMLGARVVIPQRLQRKVLEELHRDHPGIVRMKSLARSYCWWSHMDQDIEAVVQACLPCQSNKNVPSVAPLHPWLWPSKPWVRIHIDFAGPFHKKMFMLIVDAHSKWPEIIEMPCTTASKTIEELRKLFSAYGLPEQVVTDNGPQFIAEEFAAFLRQNGIKHLKCTPYHPSSNGAVERLVQLFKKSLKASESDGRTLSQRLSSFLLTYRITPHATTNATPCELFLKQSLRTRLDLLHPNVESVVCSSQAKQKAQHDLQAKGREFVTGQTVMAKNFRFGPRWLPGVITERLGPVTYLVRVKNNLTWKRHVDQLRSRPNDLNEDTDPEPESDTMSTGPATSTEPMEQSNSVPVTTSSDNTDTIPERSPTHSPSVSSTLSTSQYPRRENRKPPDRLTYD